MLGCWDSRPEAAETGEFGLSGTELSDGFADELGGHGPENCGRSFPPVTCACSLWWPHVAIHPHSTPTPSLHCYASYQPVAMGARRRKLTVSLGDKIDTLDKNAAEDSPTKRVFATVSAILTLVRVSTVAASSVDSKPHRFSNRTRTSITKIPCSYLNLVSTYARCWMSQSKERTQGVLTNP